MKDKVVHQTQGVQHVFLVGAAVIIGNKFAGQELLDGVGTGLSNVEIENKILKMDRENGVK